MEHKNNLTLIVDGNWFLMSRMFVMADKFAKNMPKHAQEASTAELHDMLARSISIMLNKHQVIDNIVVVSDGGSWRKELPIPKQLEGITYKGSRTQEVELDWDLIWNSFNSFLNYLQEIGITVSKGYGIEGDDWAWYWTRRLNENDINTLIWTSDCDLKQLVQIKGTSFTAWYNDKAGLVLPMQCRPSDDPMEYFMNPPFSNSATQWLIGMIKPVSYINPDEIAINKILCGDAGDDIKAVIRYRKGSRTYRFAQKDYEKLINETGISTVPELIKNYVKVAKNITSNPKFEKYHFHQNDVEEMLEYNTKLVWLNEAMIPPTVINKMAAEEYKQIDVLELRNNYRVMVKTEMDMNDIFNDAI